MGPPTPPPRRLDHDRVGLAVDAPGQASVPLLPLLPGSRHRGGPCQGRRVQGTGRRGCQGRRVQGAGGPCRGLPRHADEPQGAGRRGAGRRGAAAPADEPQGWWPRRERKPAQSPKPSRASELRMRCLGGAVTCSHPCQRRRRQVKSSQELRLQPPQPPRLLISLNLVGRPSRNLRPRTLLLRAPSSSARPLTTSRRGAGGCTALDQVISVD